jgi:hypothetical protein
MIADELDAKSGGEKNFKKIAKKLKIDGIVEGRVEKRREEYILRLKLREGKTGEVIGNPVDTKAEGPRIDGKAQRDITDELVEQINQLESNRATGGGDDDEDKPAKTTKKVASKDDDDEEDKPAPKKGAKTPAKKEDPKKAAKKADDDDDEDKPMAKKGAKAAPAKKEDPKKAAKKGGDDDDDDEGKPMAKKGAKAAPAKKEDPKKAAAKKGGDDDDEDKPTAKKGAAKKEDPKKAKKDDDEDTKAALKTKKDEPKKADAKKGDDDDGDDKAAAAKKKKGDDDDGDDGAAKKKVAMKDDDDGGSVDKKVEPAGPSAPLTPGTRAIDAVFGASFMARQLSFNSTLMMNKPIGYKQTLLPGGYVDATFFPLGFSHGGGLLSGLGLNAQFDRVLKVSAQQVAMDGTKVQMPITEQRYRIAAVVRFPFGAGASAALTAGYGKETFTISRGGNAVDIPNTNYTVVDPGAQLRYPLGDKLSLGVDAGVMLILKAGEIANADQYGTASVLGFEGDLNLDYMVTRSIFVRAGGRFETVGFTFKGTGMLSNSRDGDTSSQDVFGARDTHYGAQLTLGYAY